MEPNALEDFLKETMQTVEHYCSNRPTFFSDESAWGAFYKARKKDLIDEGAVYDVGGKQLVNADLCDSYIIEMIKKGETIKKATRRKAQLSPLASIPSEGDRQAT